MLTSRERVAMALAHKEPDRVPIQDSPWAASIDRWRSEGLPHHVPPEEYFGFEIVNIGADLTPRYPIKVVDRDEEFIVETTAYGGIRKNHRDRSTTPEIIDYPIKSPEDWVRIKPRLEPSYTRVDWVTARARYDRERHDGKFICYSAIMGYDLCQQYAKTDELLMMLITEPEMVRDLVSTHARLLIAQARMMLEEGFEFDGAFLYNDLGYRNGPLFSPAMYRDLFFDIDKSVTDFFHSHGMPCILHSCGNVRKLIPDLIAAGIDCLQPLEVKAGMDVRELKAEFGDRMAFMGGIDVRLMADPDPTKIEQEIASKFEVAKRGGGYIYHSDHSIPNTVSFAQFERVLALVRKYADY